MPLDPEIEQYLKAQAGAPRRSSLSIAQTREFYRGMASLAGESVELPRVEDALVAGVPVRIYAPSTAPDPGVLEYLHGGRFFSGDLETHDRVCRSLAAESGCVVVAVDYRLAPEHKFPSAAEDAYAVAASLAVDSARVGVCGDSAGANLAAAVALMARERGGPALRCQMLVYPMLDATCSFPSHTQYATGYGPGSADMQRGWHEYMAGDTDPKDGRLSPLWAADLSGLPPAFVLTAEYDSLRDEGEEYARRLERAGVRVEFRRYEGAIHGFFQMAGVFQLGRRALGHAAGYSRAELGSRRSSLSADLAEWQ